MVKAVVGEEIQLKLAEDRLAQSSLPSQVGLVIGKLSSVLDRGFVFDLVPTPPNDAGEPAASLIDVHKEDKKKGSKVKSVAADSSSLVIDRDWVAEHARQVSRMLPGGVKVIGIYVWVSESAFKNSTIMLCQTLNGVTEAAPVSGTDVNERLLVHICYSPRRWTCRSCIVTSNITSSSLRPCDFKMGRVLTSLQTFKCMYNFNFRLPIYLESASDYQRLINAMRRGISIHAEELKDAKALIDGNLVINDESCTSEDLHVTELLLPLLKNASVEACSQKDVDGILVLRGSICSFAYLNTKEPLTRAVAEIKEDIIRSLHSRIDIMCDEENGDSDPTGDGETSVQISSEQHISQPFMHLRRKKCILPFPRRVFVPWLGGTYICDYLQPSETIEVLKDHCLELMSTEVPTDTSTIFEPEKEAPSCFITEVSFWDVAVPFSSPSSYGTQKSGNATMAVQDSTKSTKAPNVNVMTAVFFLFLSISVGFLLFLQRS